MSKINCIARFCLLAMFLIQANLHAQITLEHVEPGNWWVGMKNPALQVLVHGTGIGATTPQVQYPGVKIVKVHRADSKNYLFIDILIDKNTKPGTFSLEFKKDGKTQASYPYNLAARAMPADQIRGFDASDVVYMITPDRFANGNPENDVVPGMRETKVDRKAPGGRHGGDIQGMIDHLDYISDMGFTAVWPNPLLENDMDAYSYHGYSITNHYKVDPRFGTLDDYKALATKARAKGLKLIFDGVINHIGLNYWWMQDLPFKNWVNSLDTFGYTNHRRTVNEDPYASQADKNSMTKGWFAPTMPDLNAQNPFLSTYLIQNSIWWIETLHLGGIRQDTYCYSDKTFLQNWSCSIMQEYPNFSIVGEEWTLNPLIASYWQQGKKNSDGYTGCLKSTMDFPLQSSLVKALKEPEDPNFSKGMCNLYEALANDIVYANPNALLVFGDNHDMDRIFTQLDQDYGLARMALTYLLTIRGIPQVYYGAEIYMDNTGYPGNHGVIRSDFPGGWKGDAVYAFTGQGLLQVQQQYQDYLKKLLNWRKNNPVISNGATLHFAPVKGVYVYFRYNATKTVMVIMNKNADPVNVDTKAFAEILHGKSTATEIATRISVRLQDPIPIFPKSAMVFEID